MEVVLGVIRLLCWIALGINQMMQNLLRRKVRAAKRGGRLRLVVVVVGVREWARWAVVKHRRYLPLPWINYRHGIFASFDGL